MHLTEAEAVKTGFRYHAASQNAERHTLSGKRHNAKRQSAKRYNAKRHKANRHNMKSTNREQRLVVYSADKYFQLLKGRRLIVQVERKQKHFQNHFLTDVIVNMNSPQILSQDILSGRRMFCPLKNHLLRVLTKTYEGSCCSTFVHAQFLLMATDYFS